MALIGDTVSGINFCCRLMLKKCKKPRKLYEDCSRPPRKQADVGMTGLLTLSLKSGSSQDTPFSRSEEFKNLPRGEPVLS